MDCFEFFKGFERMLLIAFGGARRILLRSGPLKKCSMFRRILQKGLNLVGPNGLVSISDVIWLDGRCTMMTSLFLMRSLM